MYRIYGCKGRISPKDTFANNRGADLAVRNLAARLSERGHAVTLFDKSEFAEKVRGDYDVIISTGTNEILDLANVDGLPPIIQQFHTDPKYPFRHWIKRWRRNRAIKAVPRKAAIGKFYIDRVIKTNWTRSFFAPSVFWYLFLRKIMQ